MRELPRSVDLRDRCRPYPHAQNQGSAPACVLESLSIALYCHTVDDKSKRAMRASDVRALYAKLTTGRKSLSFQEGLDEMRVVYGNDVMRGVLVRRLRNSVVDVKEQLSRGRVVVLGYQVDRGIEAFHRHGGSDSSGHAVLPSFIGPAQSGHAVALVGFDDETSLFLARNSWGRSWGLDGHFFVSYSELENSRFATDILTFVDEHEDHGRPAVHPFLR
jgi:hypothetical protein